MEITNYDRFNELETPALVLNSDGSVAYRNKVAEVLARYFRRVSDMAEVFPDAPDALKNCIFQGQTAIVTVQLGRECRSPALLIPDGCRNTQRAILFCSPFFKEESAAEPDRGPEKNIHTNSRVKRPEGGEYRSLSSLFLRPFILAVSRSFQASGNAGKNFRMEDVGLFLNRFAERFLSPRGFQVCARCTSDCLNFPVENYTALMSAFAASLVLLAEDCADGKIDIFISCQYERANVLFSMVSRFKDTPMEFGKYPGTRASELRILMACLENLGWSGRISGREGHLELELAGQTRFPAHFFRNSDADRELGRVRAVEELLELLDPEHSKKEDTVR